MRNEYPEIIPEIKEGVLEKYKMVPVHHIKPYENNARFHPVSQLEAVMKSIQEFGFRGSILLDKNNVIIAGHARFEAICALGWERVQCEYVDDLSEEKIAAYRILDNEIAAMGSTDIRILQIEMRRYGFDFTPYGIEFKKAPDIEDESPVKQDSTQFIVSIMCNNESEQQKVYEEMQERGYDCKLIM
jgi:ParB family transcriptional regulator, chromosome partitioning protein